MSGWWIALLVVTTVGAAAISVAAYRAHRAIAPLLDSFRECHREVTPLIAALRADSDALHGRRVELPASLGGARPGPSRASGSEPAQG